MAYTSWSVVFGEQPSAAKWNILGSNDASFNDGSGMLWNNNQEIQAKNSSGTTKKFLRLDDDNFMRLSQLPYRSDDSNVAANNTREDVLICHGWEQYVGSGTATLTGSITFGVTFASAPVVVVQLGGTKGSGVLTGIGDADSIGGGTHGVQLSGITTTKADFTAVRTSGSYGGTQYWAVHFIAIGTKA